MKQEFVCDLKKFTFVNIVTALLQHGITIKKEFTKEVKYLL